MPIHPRPSADTSRLLPSLRCCISTPSGDLLIVLTHEHARGIEHRTIHADALHRRSVRCLHAHCAASTTADGAGHELFQGNLTWHCEGSRHRSCGLQHYRGAARKDFDFTQSWSIERAEPCGSKVGNVAIEASRKTGQRAQAAGYAPLIEQWHAANHAIGD